MIPNPDRWPSLAQLRRGIPLAEATVHTLREAGWLPAINSHTAQGRPVWRFEPGAVARVARVRATLGERVTAEAIMGALQGVYGAPAGTREAE